MFPSTALFYKKLLHSSLILTRPGLTACDARLGTAYSTVTLYFIENIEDEIFQHPPVDMEEIAQKVSQ